MSQPPQRDVSRTGAGPSRTCVGSAPSPSSIDFLAPMGSPCRIAEVCAPSTFAVECARARSRSSAALPTARGCFWLVIASGHSVTCRRFSAAAQFGRAHSAVTRRAVLLAPQPSRCARGCERSAPVDPSSSRRNSPPWSMGVLRSSVVRLPSSCKSWGTSRFVSVKSTARVVAALLEHDDVEGPSAHSSWASQAPPAAAIL